MAAEKSKTEKAADKEFSKQFLQALETDTISRRLADIIKLALADRNEEIERKMEEVKLSVNQLRAEITTKDAVIAHLHGKCQQLEGANRDLKMQLDYQENQRRCDNLVFAGLTVTVADVAGDENTSSRLVQRVVDVCTNQLGCNVSANDISSAYVIPVKRRGVTVAGNKPLVAVRFTRRIIRDEIYAARSKLATHNRNATSKVKINEDLSPASRKLAAELRKKVKDKTILGTWSRNNKLYAKKNDNSVVVVSSLDDLRIL
jgi:hypothetical protein